MKNRLSFFSFTTTCLYSGIFFILKKFPLDRMWPFLFLGSVMFDFCDVTFGEQINE